MVFLGFLLVAAAIGVGAGVVLGNTGAARLDVFGQAVPGIGDQWQVFLAGAAVAVVFVVGMMLTFTGTARMLRARRDLRYLREEHEESLTTLEMEKRRLQRELDRVRQGGGSRPAPAPAPDPAPAGLGRRVAGRYQNPAASPFFDRRD
ncbi:hypothetical protein [Spirillospora albida]|uniref:hypothetical protein n=1 Tax=Spirillospora albida TaxID=58123 RepID=UPI00068F0D43|nr:hypothetical protein [Spirillospora albida]